MLAALAIYGSAGRGQNLYVGVALYSSVLLVILPVLLVGGPTVDSFQESPWSEVLAFAGQMIPGAALVLFAIFYYIFPDGRFHPCWMRWLPLVGSLLVLVAFGVLLARDAEAGWAWPVAMLALPVTLLIGLGSQFYRYFRESDDLQKSQTRPVLAALILVILVLSSSASGSARAALINLLGILAGPALLPVTCCGSSCAAGCGGLSRHRAGLAGWLPWRPACCWPAWPDWSPFSA